MHRITSAKARCAVIDPGARANARRDIALCLKPLEGAHDDSTGQSVAIRELPGCGQAGSGSQSAAQNGRPQLLIEPVTDALPVLAIIQGQLERTNRLCHISRCVLTRLRNCENAYRKSDKRPVAFPRIRLGQHGPGDQGSKPTNISKGSRAAYKWPFWINRTILDHFRAPGGPLTAAASCTTCELPTLRSTVVADRRGIGKHEGRLSRWFPRFGPAGVPDAESWYCRGSVPRRRVRAQLGSRSSHR